jgi:four helix bundle protein
MLNLNHKKLDVWKLGIKLVKEIYLITDHFPSKEIYGLTNQIRRAAISVSSNIAEGASRKSGNERKRFYEIARSSLVEVDIQLKIASELNLLTEVDKLSLSKLTNELFAKYLI